MNKFINSSKFGDELLFISNLGYKIQAVGRWDSDPEVRNANFVSEISGDAAGRRTIMLKQEQAAARFSVTSKTKAFRLFREENSWLHS